MDKEVLNLIKERHAKTCRSYQKDGWTVFIQPSCLRDSFFTVFRRPGHSKKLSVFTNQVCQRIRVNSELVSETKWKKSAKPTLGFANSNT